MHLPWTTEQVLSLAPDDVSLRTGRGFALIERWRDLGHIDTWVWGSFPIKDKPAFRTTIHLPTLTFACDCVSRKYPCPHGLGLLLLLLEQPQAFAESEPPAWVRITPWLAGNRPFNGNVPRPNPQRQANILAGLRELEQWLRDLVRNGLAGLPERPKRFWYEMADRLVDAQAGEIGRRVRAWAEIPGQSPDWPERLLSEIGRLYLLIQGFERLNTLPETVQADLRVAVGWLPGPNDTSFISVQRDHWHILGKQLSQQGRQKIQQTWLWGEQSRRPALVVELGHGPQPLDLSLVVGTVLDAELGFYASATPLRAEIGLRQGFTQAKFCPQGVASIRLAAAAYADALAANPWLTAWPVLFKAVRFGRVDQCWHLYDDQGASWPLPEKYEYGWHLQALSEGATLPLFGEWNGVRFLPLSVWTGGRWLELRLLRGVT